MKTKLGIAIAFLVLAIGTIFFVLSSNQPSDQQLIEKSLDEAVAAAREGRSGPVLDFISSQVKVNGDSMFSSKNVTEYIRKNQPDVHITQKTPRIEGDTATIVSPVRLKVSSLVGTFDQEFGNVRITLHKERVFRWLVIPGTQWKVTGVESDGAGLQIP